MEYIYFILKLILFIFLDLALIFVFISVFLNFIMEIKMTIHFKNKKGKWIIKLADCKDSYVHKIHKSGHASGELENALIFNNQYDALKAVKKCEEELMSNKNQVLQVSDRPFARNDKRYKDIRKRRKYKGDKCTGCGKEFAEGENIYRWVTSKKNRVACEDCNNKKLQEFADENNPRIN